MTLDEIAKRLGGKLISGKVRAPGPGRSARSHSLAVSLAPDLWGGIHVHDFRDGRHLENKHWVLKKLGIEPEPPRGMVSWKPPIRELEAEKAARAKEADNDAERTRRALSIWHETRSPYGTPVERYLVEQRGLRMPPEAAGLTLRFHPACPFFGERVPAMVALVRNVRTDKPVAIHRTALDRQGRKVRVNGNDRGTFGPVKGGAIKLTPEDAVCECLGIGEGIESVLSIQLLPQFGNTAVWSLISSGGIEHFPVLSGLGALWIAVDHDQAGINASKDCAARYRRAGAETFLVTPRKQGADLNDFFQTRESGDVA